MMICCRPKRKKEIQQKQEDQPIQQSAPKKDTPSTEIEKCVQKSPSNTQLPQPLEEQQVANGNSDNQSQQTSYKTADNHTQEQPQFDKNKTLDEIIKDINSSKQSRLELEKKYISEFESDSNQSEFIVSYEWLKEYENYLSGNKNGITPINNQQKTYKSSELIFFKTYRGSLMVVKEKTWKLLVGLYNGGPEIPYSEEFEFPQEFPEESEAAKPVVNNHIHQKTQKASQIDHSLCNQQSKKKNNSLPNVQLNMNNSLGESVKQFNGEEVGAQNLLKSLEIDQAENQQLIVVNDNQNSQIPLIRKEQNIVYPTLSIMPEQEIEIVGIRNPRFYCYINAALQCLMSIPQLNYFFLKEDFHKQIGSKKHNYTSEYQYFLQLVNSKSQYRFPIVSANNIQNLASDRFYYSQQQDSHEWLLHFLSEIQEELCVKSKPKTWSEYCESHDNIIDKLFTGQIKSKIYCKNCSKWSKCWDPLMDLALPLESRFFSNDCKLMDCLKSYFKEEVITDKWNCENCNKYVSNAKRQVKICQTPNILIIQIKRFSLYPQSEKLQNNLIYPENLNIQDFCKKKVSGTNYQLRATIQHIGGMDGGHYTAVTKRKKNWFIFNDIDVEPIQESDGYLKQKSAYLLFYEKKM